MTTKSFLSFLKILLLSASVLGGCSTGLGVKTKTTADPIVYGQFPTKPIWVFEAQDQVVNTPVIQDDRVFIRGEMDVYSLSAQDGTLLWKANYPVEPNVDFPQMAISDILLVPGGRSSVVSYSSEDGAVLWADHWLHSIGQSPAISITFLDDIVYVARPGATITAYEQKNGNILWQDHVLARSYLFMYNNEDSVFIAARHIFKSYDGVSGKQLFEKDFGEYIGPILIDKDILYIEKGIDQVKLVAIRLPSYTTIWETTLPGYSNFRTNTLTSYNHILLASGEALIALDKNTGELLWEKSHDEIGDAGRPIVLDSRVYVRNESGTLWSLDLDTGKYLGKVILRGNRGVDCLCEDGPAIYKDLLIVPYGDNRVFAYRP